MTYEQKEALARLGKAREPVEPDEPEVGGIREQCEADARDEALGEYKARKYGCGED